LLFSPGQSSFGALPQASIKSQIIINSLATSPWKNVKELQGKVTGEGVAKQPPREKHNGPQQQQLNKLRRKNVNNLLRLLIILGGGGGGVPFISPPAA
jgi:hypothetical protein